MSTTTVLAAKVAFASAALAAAASFARLAVPQLVSVAGAMLPRAWAVARFWLVPPCGVIVRLVFGLQVHGRRVSTGSCRGGVVADGPCGGRR